MSFTLIQPRRLLPEEVNPFSNLISKAMDTSNQIVNARYMPQQIQAEIFAKRFNPLATLATTPMFLQNPQFQAALGDLVSKNLSMGGPGFGNIKPNLPTYADQVGKDVQEAQSAADQLTKAGKVKVGASGFGAYLEKNFGEIGKKIAEAFGGGNLDPNLSNTENRFNDTLRTMKNNLVQSGRLSAQDADAIFQERKNETPLARFKRIQKTMPSLFQQQSSSTNTSGDVEDQRADDNETLRKAMAISELIKQKTGKDISENLIFNYIKEHPGKIHFPSLLKAVGE